MKLSRFVLLVAVLVISVLTLAGCKKKVPASPSETRKVFGTEVTITILDPGHTPEALKPHFDQAFAFLADWEKKTVKPGPDNQVHKLSEGAGEQSVSTDPDVFQLLMKAIRLYDNSGKTFDVRYGPMLDAWGFDRKPRVPDATQLDTLKAYVADGGMFVAGNGILLAKSGMRFDVREIALGHAFDLLAADLAKKGFRTATFQSPRVWRGMGDPPDSRGFEVHFGSPANADSAWATVWAPVGGLGYASVSAGRFEAGGKSYHSLLDPRTGMPGNRCLGAIVQSPDAATAQALAYGVFVWGGTDSLEARGKEAVGGSALITGSLDKPQVKASGSLSGRIETGK